MRCHLWPGNGETSRRHVVLGIRQSEEVHGPRRAALPWLGGLAGLCLVVGLVWGFFFTPDDFRQGSTVKIIYLHVPSAMMAINAWVMMLVASLIWLIRRHHVSALAAKAAAPVGVTMTLIALFTGAIWGSRCGAPGGPGTRG
jgi:heme exporter protein C